MTNEFLNLLELLRYGVFGEKSKNYIDADLEKVCELAMQQGVLPLVFGSLEPEERKKLSPKWEQLFFRAMMKNEQKMAALSGIIKKLEESGIQYCILKGSTVAKNYHLAECRLSGDIDLYVNPENEERTEKLFRALGMEVESRPEGKQDFRVSSPAVGLIEVHVQLYNDNFRHVVLKDKFGITEPFVKMKVNEFLTVYSLGPNDMLEFLTTHFIKHFVREGSGIRQIMDLLAYIKNNYEEIDFEKYFQKLEELRFKELILNVFGIGVKYFGLEFENYSLAFADRILDDVEDGENFGFGDVKRLGCYESFLKSRAKEDEQSKKEMDKRKRKSLLRFVFLPERKVLIKKGYTYLEKTPLLYPVAYVHRLCGLFLAIVMRKKSVSKTFEFAATENEKINSRIELMKDMNIV